MELQFRQLVSEDINSCLDIIKDIYHGEDRKKQQDDFIKDSSDVLNGSYPSKMLVAILNGSIVGFGCYFKIDSELSKPNVFYKLTWINIHPKEQGNGIGKKMVYELENYIQKDCRNDFSIILETDKPDFYKKIGYETYDKQENNHYMHRQYPKIAYPRILVGTIFSDVKDYAIKNWFKNVCSFNYPGFDFCAVDNSRDKKYHKKIFKYFSEHKKKSNIGKLTVLHTPRMDDNSDVFMAFSSNELRKNFLRGNYDALLYLECDIHPPEDIIDRLLGYNNPVISALYFTGEKSTSYPMIAELSHFIYEDTRMYIKSYIEGFFDVEEVESPKEIVSAGLGCVLIHKSVLEKIKFRYLPDHSIHSDGTFAQDLLANGIQNMYVPIMCEHDNQTWDIQHKMIKAK